MTSTPQATADFDRVVVVTPWYPTADKPMWGTFVRDAVVAMTRHYDRRITVIHVDNSPHPQDEERKSWVEFATRPEADLVVIRVPYSGMVPRGRAMEIHRAALGEHASEILAQARLVSAHVGGPSGAAVAPLLRRRTRFVITEHATYLDALFDDVSAALQYRAAVARAQRVLAVSETTAKLLRRECPQQAGIISVVPNPVRFDDLPLRSEPVRAFRRWLFVGNLVERKGVARLVEAFGDEVDQGAEPDLHLTIVGDGPLRETLETTVAERGLAAHVTFAGQVVPADVPPYYADHDVLVHLSDFETFGITLVEAAATGLPVVVTRCGGPQETLVVPSGVGTCAFVGVDPTAEAVREAVTSLRTDVTGAQLAQVRAVLRTFYGFERVADLLQKYVFGAAVGHPVAAPLGLNLVIVFDGSKEWARLAASADRAADMGMGVVAVDLSSKVTETPAGISILGTGDADRYNTFRSIERGLAERLPRLAILGLDRAGRRMLGDKAEPQFTQGLNLAAKVQRKVAATSYRVLYRRVWMNVRGLVIATRVERQPELARLGRIDVIVHMGGRRTELVYRLSRRNPTAIMHFGPFSAGSVAAWWSAHQPAISDRTAC